MTFPRAALPFLLASTVLCTAGLGAPSGAINAVWNYPSNLLSADMSFCIYATNTLAPYPWPLLTNSSAASIEDTNSFDGTNLAFRQPVQIVPGSMFFVVCASTNLEPTLPNWEVEYCPAQLFYPTNYVSPQQVGEGSSTNGAGESLWPVYMWGNSTPANGGYIYLGHDGGDSPFIQQGRDVFTNSIMPGYAPLVYPSPLAGGALTATALGSQVAGAALRNVIFH